MQVKQSVVGYGKAVKKQVMEMTRIMLRLEKIPKPDDAADAGHCHLPRPFGLLLHGAEPSGGGHCPQRCTGGRRMAEIERKKLEQRG